MLCMVRLIFLFLTYNTSFSPSTYEAMYDVLKIETRRICEILWLLLQDHLYRDYRSQTHDRPTDRSLQLI
jgi:hypothetical protein